VDWLEMIGYNLPLHDAASILSLSNFCLVTNAWSLCDHNASGLGWKKVFSVGHDESV